MACRGVHFAIDASQAARLLGAEDDDELVALVTEEMEEEWELAFETDKAWDALHRCLSDGTLEPDGGTPPLNRVFFGGRILNEDDDYFVVLATPDEVREIAQALAAIGPDWIAERYDTLAFPDYQAVKSEEDRHYTLAAFEGLPAFYARAAREGRHVIFTVDQ